MKINWRYKSFDEQTLRELYDQMVLRQEVFVVEQDCPYLDADGKDLRSHHLFAYTENNELAAYLRVVPPEISYKEVSLGRILNSTRFRRQGLGKKLMEKGIKMVNEQYGNVPIRISAQCYLKKFYNSFGFKEVGEEYLEDGIPHVEMLRQAETNN